MDIETHSTGEGSGSKACCGSGDYCLAPEDTVSIMGDQLGRQIEVINGRIWITQYGDRRDYTVASGNSFTITQPGLILIEPMYHHRACFRWKE